MAEPIVLVKLGDPSNKPQLFACPKCGRVYSWKIYLCDEATAIATAREAAENCYDCRTHNICECGKECDKHTTACPECRKKNKLARCKTVPIAEVDRCFAFDGEEFYSSPQEAVDDGCTLVHPARLVPFHLDPEGVLETILDDHHEDADESCLTGIDALYDAIETFNKAQTSGSWEAILDQVADLSSLVAKPGDEA